MAKKRSHLVTIRVTTNRPITVFQAKYAAWNAIHEYDIYGGGKDDPTEPFDEGKIRVLRR